MEDKSYFVHALRVLLNSLSHSLAGIDYIRRVSFVVDKLYNFIFVVLAKCMHSWLSMTKVN